MSQPEFFFFFFFGEIICKEKNRDKLNLSVQFKKIIKRYKRMGYNINAIKQFACLVVDPVMVDNFASLCNSTKLDRVSDSMISSPQSCMSVGWSRNFSDV